MSRLVAIDPGARKLGIAVYNDGVLTSAATLTTYSDEEMPGEVARWLRRTVPGRYDIVTERMHKRPGQTLFDEDLDRVEETRLGILRALRRRGFNRTYNPTEWKGSVPKPVHHARVEKVLAQAERAIWDENGHDARDAIAIGLFHLGRILRAGKTSDGPVGSRIASLPPPPKMEF